MSAKYASPTIRRLAQIVIVAGLYYLTARLGFLIALPPGNVTALWPPSGLGLAAVLVWDWPLGIGIFAGSLIADFEALSGSTALPVSVAIAAGATLQAWTAAWIIRRCIKTLPPLTIRDTLLTIGILSGTTLLAPTIGVTSLCLAGLASWGDYPALALTWWLGDYAGLLVFAPALVILSLRWHKQKIKEPFLWPLTSMIIGLALFVFSILRIVEANRPVAWMVLLVGLVLAGGFLGYVSSRQKSEAAIERSEAEYRALSDYALTGVARIELSGKILYLNEAAAQMIGFASPEAVLQTSIRPYLSSVAQLRNLVKVLRTSRQIRNQELDILTAQGEKRHLLCSASLYENVVSLHLADITDRIRANQELRQLSRIVSQMADTVVVANIEGVIEYVNPAFERLTGYSRAEVLGKTPRILKSGQHTLEFYQQLWDTILRGEVFQGEIINRRKNGELYYEAKMITPIRDAQGVITHFVATGKDITQQKEAENALRQKEAEYRLIADNTVDVIWILDAESQQFTYVSPSVERLRGYTPQEVLAQSMSEVLTPDSLAKVMTLLPERLAAFQQGSIAATHIDELDQVRKDGSIVHTEVATAFVPNEAGRLQVVGISRDITERQQASEMLRQSQASLEAAQSMAHLGSWELDVQRDELKWSDEIYRIFGISSQEFQATYEAFLDAIHPEDREMVNQAYQNSLQTRQPYEVVHRLLLKDGTLKYVQEKCKTYYDDEGTPLRSVGTVQDITERRRMEMEIRERVKELTCLFQISRLIGERRTAVETICTKITEYLVPAMQFPQLAIPMLILDGQRYTTDGFAEDLPHRLEADIVVNGETRGKLCVFYTADEPFIFPEEQELLNNVTLMLGLWLEQREADLAMRAAQRELEAVNRDLEKRVIERTVEVRDLYDNAPTGYHSLDVDGCYLMINQTEIKWLGYTREEMIGRSLGDFLTPESQAVFQSVFPTFRKYGEIRDIELEFVRKDGSVLPVVLNSTAVYNAQGAYVMSRSTMVDITERRKTEAALRDSRDELSAANAALEKASRLKDEFLASMSHELRTPLTSILGLAEVLQLQTLGPLNEKQLKSLKNIESSGRHLLELINDILDLSKIEAGKLDIQFESFPVADICQASLQLVKGMAHQKKQAISFSMNPVSITLRADARRLKQMLVNLLSNAVKFTPEGGKLGLEVQANEAEQNVVFCVWDKGIGIPPAELERLFQPFVQLDSSLSRQHTGTGLGLSLVQRMVELHGGGVQAESVPGAGSRFCIVLPWSEPSQSPPDQVLSASGALQDALVIEDNEVDADRAARLLRNLDVANVVHPTVTGALEKAASLHPSAILLDLNLPDGSGLGLLRELKADERTRDIPVIIVSVEERRSEVLALGALGYLLKPFAEQELRVELEKAASFSRPTDPVMVIGAGASAPLVMLADDNEIILEMLSDFLYSKGYRVIATRSGLELLERAAELHPDIMLVDIQMPGVDGLETMRRLRAHSDPAVAAAPVIAITALAMTGDRERCLQAGANEYMSKPIPMARLVEQIKLLLKKKAG